MDAIVASICVSIAELVDRVTILEIKARHSPAAQYSVQLQQYLQELDRLGVNRHIADSQRLLARINGILWRLEDEIRRCEDRREFGPNFVCVSRMIRRLNDRRAAVKGQIDKVCRSAFADIKNYNG